MACDYESIKPDILCLGKALSGGIMPISGVLTNKNIMKYIKPGTHGSTFGGNPLASVIAMEAIQIIKDENLISNSYQMGNYFRYEMENITRDFISDIRGKGLMNAIELENKQTAQKLCHNLLKNGLISTITHKNIIRLSPPLIINQTDMDKALNIIKKSINNI